MKLFGNKEHTLKMLHHKKAMIYQLELSFNFVRATDTRASFFYTLGLVSLLDVR